MVTDSDFVAAAINLLEQVKETEAEPAELEQEELLQEYPPEEYWPGRL